MTGAHGSVPGSEDSSAAAATHGRGVEHDRIGLSRHRVAAIGVRLKAARHAAGIGLDQVAEAAGLDVAFYEDCESGLAAVNDLTAEQLFVIAGLLGSHPVALLDDID